MGKAILYSSQYKMYIFIDYFLLFGPIFLYNIYAVISGGCHLVTGRRYLKSH